MKTFTVRAAARGDLPAVTAIYNHYVINTAITFDVRPLTVEERGSWFEEHNPSGVHRLLVALDDAGVCRGYASSSRWRPKPAYDTTVEASVYCDASTLGQGCGSALYGALIDALGSEDLRTIVAGVALPNPASVALHKRFGFRSVGVFHAVGRKFDRYWDVEWFQRSLK